MNGDRRPKWKKAVYAKRPGMTMGCRVLLLRLLDDMNAKGIVSVPRSQLAADFGVDPARISEWVKLARKLGFLDTVRRGRPGVTAVYQGVIPTSQGVRKPEGVHGAESAPLNGGHVVRIHPTQVAVPAELSSVPSSNGSSRDVSSDDNGVLRGERSEPAEGRMDGFEDEFIGPTELAKAAVGRQPKIHRLVDDEDPPQGVGVVGEGG